MTDPKPSKKNPKEETPKEIPEEGLEEGIDFAEMLNSPVAQSLLEGALDLFKKEKEDPDICEITIKAPSEVVLKLFNLSK